MMRPDERLLRCLCAAGFVPLGVQKEYLPDGDEIMWDTWVSYTHVSIPVVLRTIGYGGATQALYTLLGRLSSCDAVVQRLCPAEKRKTLHCYNIALRLTPDSTEIAHIHVDALDADTLCGLALSAPLIPWFDPQQYESVDHARAESSD